ncbi:MAG: hypothetical protein BGN96_12765 [Bacteroidales bacterium 45-6]|nr:MAG: hypothetical protein BGN96_12765 [Bacteroidales bacterium 45-6]
MIKHILTIIWNEKRMNSWIVIELTLIFTILWFCSDYLLTMGKKYSEPRGFDISHTYNVKLDTLSSGKNQQIKGMTKDEIFALILKRIKANPSVENVCVSVSATPYTGSFMSIGYKVDSVADKSIWTKRVTPEFFDVFRIRLEKDKGFTQMKGTITNGVLLGKENEETFLDIPIDKIDSISNNNKYKILGFVNPVKRSEYNDYSSIVYQLQKAEEMGDYKDVSIRVKPEADNPDFAEKFVKEMREQLNISPYFLVKITSLDKSRENYMGWMGFSNGLKSTFSVTSFLLINIFLGIIGTFWLRTQSRRGEIALRMALGSSKKKVRQTYILEAIVLLFIASILGVILSVNILATGALNNIGLPMVEGDSLKDLSLIQLLTDYLLTFGMLTVVTVLAVWYPSQKASRVHPAVVLREE